MLVREALAARRWICGGDAQPGRKLRGGRKTKDAPEEEALRRRGLGSWAVSSLKCNGGELLATELREDFIRGFVS
jgi:hypothetical protein